MSCIRWLNLFCQNKRNKADFVENTSWDGNGDPSAIRNDNGVNVLTAISYNYQLYGIDIVFGSRGEKIERSSLRGICKGAYENATDTYVDACQYSVKDGWERVNVTPDAFNRHELVRVEDRYHDDDSRIHMLWGTELGNDRPKTRIDAETPYGSSTGLARHVGSPNSHNVDLIEGNDFGIMVARDTFGPNQFQGLQSVGMHELGHALSIGWRDDTEPPHDLAAMAAPKSYEVYSGNRDDQNLTGGLDPTPETVTLRQRDPDWSIMREGTAENSVRYTGTSADFPVLLFSIEELSTVDFKHVPSQGS